MLIRRTALGIDRNPASHKLPEVRRLTDPEFDRYWQAFTILSRQRNYSVGFGAAVPERIPVSEMIALAKAMDEEDIVWFVDTMSQMDAVYVAEIMKRMKRD